MSEIRWIKVAVRMFDDEKIRTIESMPKADHILVVWMKLLCLAGKVNADGFVSLTEQIPYTEKSLANVLRCPLKTVKLAMETFQKFGMIEYDSRHFIFISNWNCHQNVLGLEEIREKARLKKRRQRAKLAVNIPELSRDMSRDVPPIEVEVELDKRLNPLIPLSVSDPLSLEEKSNPSPRGKTKKPNPEDDPLFAEFWELYPRKIDRIGAAKCWQARINEGVKPEEMIKAAGNYAVKIRAAGREECFTLHPSTFLGPTKRYLDYMDGEEKGGSDYDTKPGPRVDPSEGMSPAERKRLFGTKEPEPEQGPPGKGLTQLRETMKSTFEKKAKEGKGK